MFKNLVNKTGQVINLEYGILECQKMNCSKFLARNHFSLENSKLKFNLENEWLEYKH